MPSTFHVGTTVTTTDPFVDVTPSPDAPIPPGVHHFQLVVYDEAGNASTQPAVAQVVVKDTINPTAVLTIVPSQAQPGQPFRLDGTKSSDVPPGTVVKYVWTMVD